MLQPDLLRGTKVRLTAVSKADLPTMAVWWSNADFLRFYDALPAFPKSEEQLEKRIESGQIGSTTFLFGIRPLDSDKLLDLLEFDGVIWSNGTTFVSIAIGDPVDQRQGLGYEAMRLGLRYAFQELNLYRVCLTVFSYNEPAIRLYEKLGFSREGVFREHLHRDGKRYDMILFGLLQQEWDLDITN